MQKFCNKMAKLKSYFYKIVMILIKKGTESSILYPLLEGGGNYQPCTRPERALTTTLGCIRELDTFYATIKQNISANFITSPVSILSSCMR